MFDALRPLSFSVIVETVAGQNGAVEFMQRKQANPYLVSLVYLVGMFNASGIEF